MTAVALHCSPLCRASRRPSALLAAALVCLVLAGAVAADEKDNDRTAFVLRTVAGDEHRGPLLALRESWTVQLGGQKRFRCDGQDWLSLRQANRACPSWPSGPHLILSNGDRIPIAVDELSIVSDIVQFRHAALADGKESKLGLSSVAAVFLALPDSANDMEVFCRRLATERPRRDVVLLRNGDSLEGILIGLDMKGVRVRGGQKTASVDLAKIAAVSLSNLGGAKPQMPDIFGRLTLLDGSRLTLRDAVCADGERLSGMTLLGMPYRVPVRDVGTLDLHHARVVYLSDLKPAKYEHTPFLGAAWPLGVDATATGRGLRLGGGVCDRGLGMHSTSRVTYSLPDGAKRFEARVGLDDHLGVRGSVRVRVLIDGKERDLGLRGDLTHRGGPLAVSLDLTGAKELTLIVDFGANGDVGDHVNWCDARIVR